VRSYRRDWVGFFIALMTNTKTQLKTRFLPHDYNARNDLKLINLQIKHGLEGLGLYWCLVEMVWEADNELDYDPDLIAFALRTDAGKVKSVAEGFNLFQVEAGILSSTAVAKRMAYFTEKSEKAKQAASKRWGKETEADANALQTHSERIAINKETNKETKKERNKDLAELEFTPPSVSLILDEFPSFRDAKRFVDFYTSKGWKVGAAPMADWRAAVRSWIERENEKAAQLPPAQRPRVYKKATLD